MSFSGICFSGINVFFYLFREYKCTIRVPDKVRQNVWPDLGPNHARIQDFRQGGGGGSGQSDKKGLTTVFFSPHFILQKSNGQFHRKLPFFKVPEMVNFTENYLFSKFQKGSIFPGGPTFSRGRPIAHSL